MILSLAIQVTEIKEILSIESISVMGLLLLIVVALVYDRRELTRKHEKERVEMKQEIQAAYDKLDDEFKSSSAEMKVFIEKYYTITTKFLEKINTLNK